MRRPLDPLGHPAREEIMVALEVIGDLTTAELEGQLPADCSRATTVYHLRVLEQAGLVVQIGGVWHRTRTTKGPARGGA